jgi:hypothetical protein
MWNGGPTGYDLSISSSCQRLSSQLHCSFAASRLREFLFSKSLLFGLIQAYLAADMRPQALRSKDTTRGTHPHMLRRLVPLLRAGAFITSLIANYAIAYGYTRSTVLFPVLLLVICAVTKRFATAMDLPQGPRPPGEWIACTG